MTKTAWREMKSAEEMAQRLESEGYQVEYEVSASDGERLKKFDMVARRNGDAVVFEFVPLRNFDKFAPRISDLRRLAAQEGYTDFRVIVVTDTKTAALEITGLESDLLVIAQNRWQYTYEKENWSAFILHRFESVSLFSVQSTNGEEGARVTGQCVVEFVSSINSKDIIDCPMTFDLRLDRYWKVIIDDVRNRIKIILGAGL